MHGLSRPGGKRSAWFSTVCYFGDILLDLCVFKSEEDVNEQQTGIRLCYTEGWWGALKINRAWNSIFEVCVSAPPVRKLTELKTKHTQKLPQHRKEIFIVVFTELCRGDKFLCVCINVCDECCVLLLTLIVEITVCGGKAAKALWDEWSTATNIHRPGKWSLWTVLSSLETH